MFILACLYILALILFAAPKQFSKKRFSIQSVFRRLPSENFHFGGEDLIRHVDFYGIIPRLEADFHNRSPMTLPRPKS